MTFVVNCLDFAGSANRRHCQRRTSGLTPSLGQPTFELQRASLIQSLFTDAQRV